MAAAWAYAVLGEQERAIDWLEYIYERHGWLMLQLNMDRLPLPGLLKDHPRYQDLVRRMNFPR